MTTRTLSFEDYKAGHAPCECGEYTFVFRLAALTSDCTAELCPRCELFMCRLDALSAAVSEAAA